MNSFKPTLYFLLRFAIVYALGSIAYSWMIKSYHPHPDPATEVVAEHLRISMNVFGADLELYEIEEEPYIGISFKGEGAISLFEGCNGLAVMILFLAFVLAFRGKNVRSARWFIPVGILSIHLFNILRLALLILASKYQSGMFHFYHKFLFTGIIYAFVLLLWIWWVRLQQGSFNKAHDE